MCVFPLPTGVSEVTGLRLPIQSRVQRSFLSCNDYTGLYSLQTPSAASEETRLIKVKGFN